MSDLYSILAEWYPEGKYTEADLWEAIAEAEGVDVNEIMDRDLIEFI
jgi:pyrroloquinoline quinone (PQQ) biosynthesis protein C